MQDILTAVDQEPATESKSEAPSMFAISVTVLGEGAPHLEWAVGTAGRGLGRLQRGDISIWSYFLTSFNCSGLILPPFFGHQAGKAVGFNLQKRESSMIQEGLRCVVMCYGPWVLFHQSPGPKVLNP